MNNTPHNIKDVFKKYYKELCFISLRYVKDLSESEDVVQDVFLKILSQNKFSKIKNPEAYLRIAVRNASIRSIEKSRRTIAFDPQSFLFLCDDSSEEITDYLNKEAELYRQIEKLPKVCREVFLMCGLDGLKYQDAADKLNVSINTIKTHMKKAYKNIRASITVVVHILMIKRKK